MNLNTQLKLLSASAILTFSLSAIAANEPTKTQTNKDDRRIKVMERITIIGSQDKREEIPGAASLVTKETLDRYQYTDIHRALQEVPGITLQEEDGHGLRPNIGIRGGRSNRSADITLMEDGILAAPAPYSAPEAYYFPQMDRMQSLEVIKGVGAVKYGPRTTNGVLNMITNPIPAKNQADIIAEGGSHGTYRTGITTGTSVDNFGVMVNAFHKESQGFKEIDFVGGNTGYNTEDILTKFRINSAPGADRYQEIEFKIGYYDEVSNETYLGLTDSDFGANPNRRYGSSQLDKMTVTAKQAAITHFIELSESTNLTTTLYRNEVERAWYKLDSVRIGGVTRSLSAIFNDQTTNAAYISALQGATSAGGTSFNIRNNAREYYSQGVQSVLGYDYEIGNTKNKLEAGIRLHQDEEDRFQRDDVFVMSNGQAIITSVGAAGGAGNRISSADAWSGFIQNELSWNKWTFTPGIRFEHIDLRRDDYGNSDPARTGSALTVLENGLDVWIPGIGASYALTDSWKLLAGVHKGFAPPGVPANANDAAFTQEEESINYELGTRYKQGNWAGELFGFFTDYSNLLGRDTLSSGGAGSSDTYNGGEVEVKGLEATAQYNAANLIGISDIYRLPVTVTYTLTQGEFQTNLASSFEEWGTVSAGDELPYIPQNQIHISAGLETDEWGFSVGSKFVDEMRSTAGSGAIPENQKIDAHWTVDVAGEYKVAKNITAFATIENLLDETYIAARRPAGVRPGLPLTAMAGVKISLW